MLVGHVAEESQGLQGFAKVPGHAADAIMRRFESVYRKIESHAQIRI